MIAAMTLAAAMASGGSTTVQSGQTLSGIAAAAGVSLSQVEAANPQISNPNMIYAGQAVNLSSGGSSSGYVPQHASGSSSDSEPDSDGDDSGYVPQHAAPAQQPQVAQAPSSSNGSSPTGIPGWASCIVQRESGGNPGAVNASSGAGGLFQFLPSTWSGLGLSGSPQNASVSQQIAAANQLHAQSGLSPWAADGCPGT